ncbi:uncharacterized protein LOC130648739 [Hydractinia symbiolongicarpus]|uniref:uncharacterized protein LOC130648739 n=1 Tax=Hydractinia symbiolongicarpus TaxID=13093 RepID=UPI00254A06AA|nr:uncharacterized protein LOC130648739 [Hydractinia symbiolongicarpus]
MHNVAISTQPILQYSSGQGSATATVLTNRAKHLTVISPKTRISLNDNNVKQVRKKGQRAMHRTTFTFETQPVLQSYVSTTKREFSGNKNLPKSYRPPRCPSQHKSHFSLGDAKDTPTRDNSLLKVITKMPVHEDRVRWKSQMAGENMQRVLSSNVTSYDMVPRSTTYDKSRNSFKTPFLYKHLPMEKIDIITGASYGYSHNRDYRLISGNRVLQHLRNNSKDPLLG